MSRTPLRARPWTDWSEYSVVGFPNQFFYDSWVVGLRRTDASRSRRGDKAGTTASFSSTSSASNNPEAQRGLVEPWPANARWTAIAYASDPPRWRSDQASARSLGGPLGNMRPGVKLHVRPLAPRLSGVLRLQHLRSSRINSGSENPARWVGVDPTTAGVNYGLGDRGS